MNNGRQLYCAFIDFTKAFDYVVRDNLWFKLLKLGIRGKHFDIIKSMYSAVKSQVKNSNKLSVEFDCSLGVRQGECLSLFLFAMFLNDMEDMFIQNGVEDIDINMFKVLLILYADDIVLFTNSQSALHKSLDVLDYCCKWNLTVNTSNTKIMVFKRGRRLPK